MLMALSAVKQALGLDLPNLKSVILGGAILSPDHLHNCVCELGAKAVENTYGMTEGVFITLGRQEPDVYISGDEVTAGKAFPGAGVKICSPDQTVPVPRGAVGELHYHGNTVCDTYVGKATDDWYTDDDGRTWFKTGDQARMDEEGRIFIIGRYKDIVIRGGKNLACMAMEANLGKQAFTHPNSTDT